MPIAAYTAVCRDSQCFIVDNPENFCLSCRS